MTSLQLDPKKLMDTELRMQWQGILTRLQLAHNKVKRLASLPSDNPDRPEYLEAVNEYHRVREEERAFFYKSFFKEF
jgi:hypothetical protein